MTNRTRRRPPAQRNGFSGEAGRAWQGGPLVTVLPSPLPHPLDRPVDVPAWARPALEWVVGFDWPPETRSPPGMWPTAGCPSRRPDRATDPAVAAAAEIISGYGGAGIMPPASRAWHRLSGDESAR